MLQPILNLGLREKLYELIANRCVAGQSSSRRRHLYCGRCSTRGYLYVPCGVAACCRLRRCPQRCVCSLDHRQSRQQRCRRRDGRTARRENRTCRAVYLFAQRRRQPILHRPLHADFSSDTGFAVGYLNISPSPSTTGNSYANAIAIQPDGKIVVAGQCNDATGTRFCAARVLADGNPDATFGFGGSSLRGFNGVNNSAAFDRVTRLQSPPTEKFISAVTANKPTLCFAPASLV